MAKYGRGHGQPAPKSPWSGQDIPELFAVDMQSGIVQVTDAGSAYLERSAVTSNVLVLFINRHHLIWRVVAAFFGEFDNVAATRLAAEVLHWVRNDPTGASDAARAAAKGPAGQVLAGGYATGVVDPMVCAALAMFVTRTTLTGTRTDRMPETLWVYWLVRRIADLLDEDAVPSTRQRVLNSMVSVARIARENAVRHFGQRISQQIGEYLPTTAMRG